MTERKIDESNFHKKTKATFSHFPNKSALGLLVAFQGKFGVVEYEGDQYSLLHRSNLANFSLQNLGFSIYLMKENSGSIIRISDHWSSSKNNDESEKLNCYKIRSCIWHINNKEEKFQYFGMQCGKHPWELIGGICSFVNFEALPDE